MVDDKVYTGQPQTAVAGGDSKQERLATVTAETAQLPEVAQEEVNSFAKSVVAFVGADLEETDGAVVQSLDKTVGQLTSQYPEHTEAIKILVVEGIAALVCDEITAGRPVRKLNFTQLVESNILDEELRQQIFSLAGIKVKERIIDQVRKGIKVGTFAEAGVSWKGFGASEFFDGNFNAEIYKAMEQVVNPVVAEHIERGEFYYVYSLIYNASQEGVGTLDLFKRSAKEVVINCIVDSVRSSDVLRAGRILKLTQENKLIDQYDVGEERSKWEEAIKDEVEGFVRAGSLQYIKPFLIGCRTNSLIEADIEIRYGDSVSGLIYSRVEELVGENRFFDARTLLDSGSRHGFRIHDTRLDHIALIIRQKIRKLADNYDITGARRLAYIAKEQSFITEGDAERALDTSYRVTAPTI